MLPFVAGRASRTAAEKGAFCQSARPSGLAEKPVTSPLEARLAFSASERKERYSPAVFWAKAAKAMTARQTTREARFMPFIP
jgi:hypothetical protein